jgi:hypothetical protein
MKNGWYILGMGQFLIFMSISMIFFEKEEYGVLISVLGLGIIGISGMIAACCLMKAGYYEE